MAEDPNALVQSEERETTTVIEDYWTEEALRTAVPLEVEAPVGSVTMDERWSAGEEVATEPAGPDGGAAAGWDPQPSCPASGSNTERAPNRSIIPYSAVGKLYMTHGGVNYVGSAWTIAESGVFTAGHCLFEKATGWATNVLFIPQYHKGTEPVGRWAATRLVSLTGWTANRDFRFDLAAFKVDRPIRPKTGSLGWLANGKPDQGPITGIGFPAAPPFDGREMWRSTGKNCGGANPIKAYNNMTGGCSGGPWEIWRDGVPLSNGINSFRYTSDPATMYSPYFGEGFLNLFNWVK